MGIRSGEAPAAEFGATGIATPDPCPHGYLGVVHLVDAHPSAGCCAPWGDPDADVFHWVLIDPHPFVEPVPGLGKRGLYWVTPEDLEPD